MTGIEAEEKAAHVALFGTRREKLAIGARALVALLRDPDDTRQVFLIGLAANGRKFPEFFVRFAATEEGARLMREQPSIDTKSIDYDALRALPADTLGGAYVRYLDENKLDPDLFQAPPGLPPMIAWFGKRIRQTHDIWHVLTGYRPDVPGEVALQAFTFAQTRMPSSAIIALFGGMRASLKKRGMFSMTLEGYRRGKAASFLASVPWEQHFTRPIDDVRRELGIAKANFAN